MFAAVLTVLVATPSLAQEPPSSADLLALFAGRCAEVSTDPRAAINALMDREAEASGAMTADGALAQVTEPLARGLEDQQVLFFFNQTVVEGVARQGCSLTAYDLARDGAIYPDMADVAGAQAEAILGGPAVRVGGPVLGGTLSEGATLARMLVWHREGADGGVNGPVLTLTQDARTLMLSLGRTVPAP